MRATVDTHLHLYPDYDINQALECFLSNTDNKSAPLRIGCLAERHDCQIFESIANSTLTLTAFKLLSANATELVLQHNSGNKLTLIAGRQVISSENIEVLALGCAEMIEDGQSAASIIKLVHQQHGVPVVAWSPGKWFFSRGKLIRSLIKGNSPDQFVIGDTTLRPHGWLTPVLMRSAINKGFKVIAGSDPLPFSGEEQWLGRYHSEISCDQSTSALALIQSLLDNKTNTTVVNRGQRTNFLTLLKRLKGNADSKNR